MKKLSTVLLVVCSVCTVAAFAACEKEAETPTPPPTHEHAYTSAVVNPTCTEKGYTKYTCECGDTYNADEVAATGHTFGAWVEEIPSNCTTNGTKGHYTCSVCEKDFDEGKAEIADLTIVAGHSYQYGVCVGCEDKRISEGLEYTLNGSYYVVSGLGTCTDTNIVIPDTYENLPIKEIGGDAFTDALIESIWIPDSVTKINTWAFFYCTNLRYVHLGDGMQEISAYAFSGCSALTQMTITRNVHTIGNGAFNSCERLVEVLNYSSLNINTTGSNYGNLGNFVKNVIRYEADTKLSKDENGLLYYTDGNEKILMDYTGENASVVIPEGVTEIYKYAFFNNTNITNVVISEGVTKIGSSSFSGCTNLTSITVPVSVTEVWGGVTSGCTALQDVYYGGTESDWGEIYFAPNNEILLSATLHYTNEE